jgi:flavin-dependent dehydrogenase
MSRTYDVAVVGGGPAGAVTALLLARAGRRVLVLESSSEAGLGSGYRGGESLPPQANPLLRRLGLEEVVRRGPHLPCHGTVSSWGSPRPVDTDFLFSPHGHGWHLDRGVFDRELLAAAEEAGVVVERPARVVGVEGSRSPWHLSRSPWHLSWRLSWNVSKELPGEGPQRELRRARARFVVDASGLSRVLLRRLRIPIRRLDRLVAFVATVADDGSEGSDARSVIEAVRDGWWYRGRLPGGRQAVAAFTDAGSEAAARLGSPDGFFRELGARQRGARPGGASHLVARVDAGKRAGGPWIRSAASARAERAAGEGWLAVGDAAASFDPLSSQGMLSALAAAERAGAALEAALDGEAAALPGYQAFLDRAYADFLEHRRRFYRMEGRWPASPFWARRHGLPRFSSLRPTGENGLQSSAIDTRTPGTKRLAVS